MLILLAFLMSFVPALACAYLVYWLDRYEKEPKLLLGAVFGWGAVVAILGAVVAQLILGEWILAAGSSAQAADVAGTTLFAPLTEESLKGFAVLAVFVLLRREFDSLLDGLVYAGITALGFAATEDFFYLMGAADEGGLGGLVGLFFLRIVLGIWGHPFYTAFIGIGLAMARLSRNAATKWLAPFTGWAAACFFHFLHNGLATAAEHDGAWGLLMFATDWLGWLGMGVVVLLAIRHEGRLLGAHLADEVQAGLITPQQYQTALSTWAQTGARWRALSVGQRAPTKKFYRLCGKLAHKKAHLAHLGDEHGNWAEIQELRAQIAMVRHLAVA